MSFATVVDRLSDCSLGSKQARSLVALILCAGTVGSGWADPIFSAATPFGVGGGPYSVAIGDLNADGNPDLVSANSAGTTVSVLLGNGDGTFETYVNYTTGSGPNCVAIGDLNGDLKPDLVTTSGGGNTLSVLLGNGNGTFQPNDDYATGSGPGSVAIGDVNGDSKPDLVVANLGSGSLGSVSVRLGNGDGTFQANAFYATGPNPKSVKVLDVSGDGKPDILTENATDTTASVLLGNGDGTFQTNVFYGTGAAPYSIAVQDLNNDGKPDLVTADYAVNTASVLLGNGDGTFQANLDYGVGPNPTCVAIGDVSGDGKPDLVTANSADTTASVLLGNGDGSFQTKVDYGAGSGPVSVAIGDLNGDLKPDLVTANPASHTVSVLRNLTGVTTAISVLMLSAEATAGRVRLEWYAPGDRISLTSVYRRTADSDWTLQGHPEPDESRRIVYEDETVSPGVSYGYRLVVRDVTGSEAAIETWVSVPEARSAPTALRLESARPNPFGRQAELSYGLPRGGRVRLDVYDVRGRRVASVVDRVDIAGWRSVVWDGRDRAGREVASGTYFLRLESGGQAQVGKVVLAR